MYSIYIYYIEKRGVKIWMRVDGNSRDEWVGVEDEMGGGMRSEVNYLRISHGQRRVIHFLEQSLPLTQIIISHPHYHPHHHQHFIRGPAPHDQRSTSKSIPDPAPHGQRQSLLPDPARIPMSYPRNSAAQSSDWRADAMGPSTQAGRSRPSNALAIQRPESLQQIPWPMKFTNFFKLTEEWARNYTNAPNRAKDQALPGPLMDSLGRLSDPDQVMHLLSCPSTRYFLVAKMINSWISNDFFHPNVLNGYAKSFDNDIREYRNMLQSNDPVNIRHALLRAIADTIKDETPTDEFKRYAHDRVLMRVGQLWERLTVFFAPGILKSRAWDDLQHIVSEAFRIGILMLSTPLSYGFEYPSVGRNQVFNPSSMINRDISFKDDPVSLQRRGLRIRLGITPVIVVTDFIGPTTRPQTVHFANVLLQR